jgi:hypothetical protein
MGVRLLAYGLTFLLGSCTFGTYTLQDDAYHQNNPAGVQRGTSSHGLPTGNIGYSGAALSAVAATPEIILDALNRSKSYKNRKALCTELYEKATAPNSAAWDWQSYFSRCGS